MANQDEGSAGEEGAETRKGLEGTLHLTGSVSARAVPYRHHLF